MRHLKIDPRLLSNPIIYEKIKQSYEKFESFKPIKDAKTRYLENSSIENLEAYIDAVKQNRILTQEEVHILYRGGREFFTEDGEYQTMSIDPKTGHITFQTILEKAKEPSKCDSTTFAVDKKGHMLIDETTTTTNTSNMEDSSFRKIYTFNSDGIYMSLRAGENTEDINVGHQDFKGKVSVERDQKNPFIFKQVITGRDTIFRVVSDDFNNLIPPSKSGNEFTTYDHALAYYNENRSTISGNITRLSISQLQLRHSYLRNPYLDKTLDGICKLAINAGLSGFETPTEPRI